MTRDYSDLFPALASKASTTRELSKLERLGWQPFFAQQADIDLLETTPPVRVIEVHRTGLHVLGDGIDQLVPSGPDATVGDWLFLDRTQPAQSVVLERKSLIKRRAPGTDRKAQLIAANLDTAFIVTSCNQDFNLARLERYVALAFEAEVTPAILLTKADLCDDADAYVQRVAEISDRVMVLSLNALSDAPKDKLGAWCKPGQTVGFLGSSGVGKSTLVNALMGDNAVETASVREDDAKGRHTTTRRQLHLSANGCNVLDTPGMRELQLTDAQDGIADVFEDISRFEGQCKFNDCQHETEPGCAILQALADGAFSQDRLERWSKLKAEERFNSASLAQRKSGDKSLHKTIKAIQKNNRK
ncbi:MAG: ribosome small subunit-dependent GTPase A [Paracoccaceae bacterium]